MGQAISDFVAALLQADLSDLLQLVEHLTSASPRVVHGSGPPTNVGVPAKSGDHRPVSWGAPPTFVTQTQYGGEGGPPTFGANDVCLPKQTQTPFLRVVLNGLPVYPKCEDTGGGLQLFLA